MANRIASFIGATFRALKLASYSARDAIVSSYFGSSDTASGVVVNETTAFNYSAVWAATRLIAEALASLPLYTYQRIGAGKSLALEHPVYNLLHNEPNSEMTPIACYSTMQAHALLPGNAYAEIERDNAGRPLNIWPLLPNMVEPVRTTDGKLAYRVWNKNGEAEPLIAANMLHIPGMGWNGLTGLSIINLARESIGMGMATERFGAGLFGNGAHPQGILTAEGRLSEKQKKTMRRSWDDAHKGLSRAHRTAILDAGASYQKITLTPEEAQFLETRRFNLTEIARWFNIPNHMLRDLSRATYSNIEQAGLEFVTYTIRPWAKRWEQECNRKLFTKDERKQFYTRFHLLDLLKGDINTRYKAYQIGLMMGFLNADEVRDDEDMNPIPDGGGQTYRFPAQTMPVDDKSAPQAQSKEDIADDTQD